LITSSYLGGRLHWLTSCLFALENAIISVSIAAKLFTKAETQRIAANIAKLLELLRKL
jgi:hypothetical protein